MFIKTFLDVGKGATNALILLRLIQPTDTSKKTLPHRIAVALELYRYVREKLDSLGRSYLMPDIIHFEHLLCKVKRILECKFYSVFRSPFFLLNLPKSKSKAKAKAKGKAKTAPSDLSASDDSD